MQMQFQLKSTSTASVIPPDPPPPTPLTFSGSQFDRSHALDPKVVEGNSLALAQSELVFLLTAPLDYASAISICRHRRRRRRRLRRFVCLDVI